MVLEMLDWGWVNSRFFYIYPMVIEKHTVKDSSNHIPICSICMVFEVIKRIGFFALSIYGYLMMVVRML